MRPLPVFDHLNAAQSDGLACIVDGVDFTTTDRPHVPVGRSMTGSQVFACASPCAPSVGYVPPAVETVSAR